MSSGCRPVKNGVMRCVRERRRTAGKPALEFVVMDRGSKIGEAELQERNGALVVGMIDVHSNALRRGVGTKLYEAMLEEACSRGMPLQSDHERSPYAEAFWRKQVAKGRAICGGEGRGKYVEPWKGDGTEPGLPRPDRELEWPCRRYEIVAPCAHPELRGVRRRR
jgi:GNAT superfamily N-acetyltransferase